jgi:short-subunit dehydrogenase
MARRDLAGSRVLLTGASSGIGRELALALAQRGANLLITARREQALMALTAECATPASACEFVPGDVTNADLRATLVSRVVELWGGLDVLVNNAGVSAHGRFADSDEATLRRVMEVNFFAAAELTRLVLPLLGQYPERAEASPAPAEVTPPAPAIVNIGSIIGHRGLPLDSEYSASKFALRGWSEALRAELASQGIDVLLVSPGTTETEFFEHLLAKREKLPWGNAVGIPAAVVAEQTMRALERGRREIFPNWRGRAMVVANRRAMVVANRLFPGLVDRAVANLARGRDGS